MDRQSLYDFVSGIYGRFWYLSPGAIVPLGAAMTRFVPKLRSLNGFVIRKVRENWIAWSMFCLLVGLLCASFDTFDEERTKRITAEQKLNNITNPSVTFEFSDNDPKQKYVGSPSSRTDGGKQPQYDYWSVAVGVKTNVTLTDSRVQLVSFRSVHHELSQDIDSPSLFPWWTSSNQFSNRLLVRGETRFEVMNSVDGKGDKLLFHVQDLPKSSPLNRLSPGTYEFTVSLSSPSLPLGDIQQKFRFVWSGQMSNFQMEKID